MSIAPIKQPCASCPWRVDAAASHIPQFDIQLAERLARCCPDERGVGPDHDASLFACHLSKPEHPFACAGWLAQVGRAHVGVRLAVMAGRISVEQLDPQPGWPELHSTYPEVLQKLRRTVREA